MLLSFALSCALPTAWLRSVGVLGDARNVEALPSVLLVVRLLAACAALALLPLRATLPLLLALVLRFSGSLCWLSLLALSAGSLCSLSLLALSASLSAGSLCFSLCSSFPFLNPHFPPPAVEKSGGFSYSLNPPGFPPSRLLKRSDLGSDPLGFLSPLPAVEKVGLRL